MCGILYLYIVYFLKIKKNFFWPHCVACVILVPQPGIEPTPWIGRGSLNHWTAREVLYIAYIDSLYDTLNTHSFMILNGMFSVDEKDGQSENELTWDSEVIHLI